MSFIVTSKKFYDQFTSTGGGGVDALNGCVGDLITCVIEGYFKWSIEDIRLEFNSADKQIIMENALDNRSFIDEGFKIGDTITIVDTASNDGDLTITAVEDRIITVSEAIVDENAESAYIYGVTPITAMDFYFNLLQTNAPITYASLVDKGTLQRYTIDDLDASDTTPKYMIVGSDSYGWVSDTLTGETSEVKVEGVAIADYKQKFKITQTFYQGQIWGRELVTNFINRKAPESFLSGNRLNHVCRIDGKFNYNNPTIPHTGSSIDTDGIGCWFNQNNVGSRPEYSVVSIGYVDAVTLLPVETIDVNRKTNVVLIINSRSGKFTTSGGGGTLYKLTHILCPLDEVDYVDTLTTLPQNLRMDSKFTVQGLAAANGAMFGTDYQSLTDIQFVQNSVNQVTCTFSVEYSNATKTFLKTQPDLNRYYAFILSTQDKLITTTLGTDRVNLICDFRTATYDQQNADLFGLIDYIHCFQYPDEVTNDKNDIAGYEGDYQYVSIPFWVETAVAESVSPTLLNLGVQIVATKTDEDDFVLEEKIFDTATIRKLSGVQSVDIRNERNFILPVDSPYNRCTLRRVPENDDGTKMAYELRYGFALRYETWRQVVQSALGAQYDIFKNIEDVVHGWERYSQGNGWELKFRMNVSVQGYDSFTTDFTTETDIKVLKIGDTPTDGPDFDTDLKFYDVHGNSIPGILDNDLTRVVAVFTGPVATFPTGYDQHYGYIFADVPDSGGIFNRRYASTSKDAEDDSPFSTTELPVNADENTNSYSKNLRISIFDNRIELDCWYNGIGVKNKTIIYPKLGFLGEEKALGFANRTPIYLANGKGIALN